MPLNKISASLPEKLLFYSLGTAATTAATVAQTGSAAVVTTPGNTTAASNTFYFNLQSAAESTTTSQGGFQLSTGASKAKASGNSSNYLFETTSRSGPNGAATNYVVELSSNTTISAGTFTQNGTFNDYSAGYSYNGNPVTGAGKQNGDWKTSSGTVPTRGFVGLEILGGKTTPLFGFADMTVNNYNGTGTFNLNGFAYDPTGASINTFTINAVPEPGTTTALLVAGAAGVAALRRRKKVAAPVTPEG